MLAVVALAAVAVNSGLLAVPPGTGHSGTGRDQQADRDAGDNRNSEAGRDAEGFTRNERDAGAAQPRSSSSSRTLKSPLLRGLQQSLGEIDALQDGEAADSLTRSLEQTDSLLNSVRGQSRRALKAATRQQRVGPARRSPNLLLITIDRLGWQEPGCCGQERIRTPQIDRLAAQGLRLTRFYAGSADAQAARWTLLTGLNSGHAPTDRRDRFRIHDDDRTMAEWLWDAGYVTAFFGLWTNGDSPIQHGFDDWSGFPDAAGIADGFPETLHVDGSVVQILGNRDGGRQVSMNRLLASELHSWFEDVRSARRQFFVHVALPILDGTISSTATSAGSREAASGTDPLPARSDTPSLTPALANTPAQSRRAAVERTDELIGQLLDVLSAAGLADRTCVILTAESGPDPAQADIVQALNLTGELRHARHGLAEGNLRVPLIVRWPGQIEPGTVRADPAVVCDLLPTLCELAAASRRPQRTDGVSLVPLLVGREQPVHPLLYWETPAGKKGQIAQVGAWKCVRLPGSREISLYNLDDDPAERVNVADRHPDVLRQLTR